MSTTASKILTYWYICLFLWVLLARGLRLPLERPVHMFPAATDLSIPGSSLSLALEVE